MAKDMRNLKVIGPKMAKKLKIAGCNGMWSAAYVPEVPKARRREFKDLVKEPSKSHFSQVQRFSS